MLVRHRKGWETPEHQVTSESAYQAFQQEREQNSTSRRNFIFSAGATGALGAVAGSSLGYSAVGGAASALAATYPGPRNPKYTVERELTNEEEATTYNNFYEFGSQKYISDAAQNLKISPWKVRIDGMVEQEKDIDFEDILKNVTIEERIYRHRCVEAWAMTVPWSGFPLKDLVALAKPVSGVRYVQFQTLEDPRTMPGLRQTWWPWPYTEGVTMEEAMNDVAFIATGLYGKKIHKQNGAPLRLVLPWKYGFKSIKSIVRMTFTNTQPQTFWEVSQKAEYGFYANVNPAIDHPRWSQATERLLGSGDRVPTRIYNGYGEFVAGLYVGMEEKIGDRLFR